MRHTMNASEPLPEYVYMKLPNGEADVFIYKFKEKTESGFIYETNEFRTHADVVSEADVAANPSNYLDYVSEVEKSLEQRIKELERLLGLRNVEEGDLL